MGKLDACFSSQRPDWETPDDLFDELDQKFHFTVDAAASPSNTKVLAHFYCEEHWYRSQRVDGAHNGFGRPYGKQGRETVWCNPPYGRGIGVWVAAAKTARLLHGTTTVLLLPARTDTAWWHDYLWDEQSHRPQEGVEIRLLRGRVKFKGATSSAPFPSVVVVVNGMTS